MGYITATYDIFLPHGIDYEAVERSLCYVIADQIMLTKPEEFRRRLSYRIQRGTADDEDFGETHISCDIKLLEADDEVPEEVVERARADTVVIADEITEEWDALMKDALKKIYSRYRFVNDDHNLDYETTPYFSDGEPMDIEVRQQQLDLEASLHANIVRMF